MKVSILNSFRKLLSLFGLNVYRLGFGESLLAQIQQSKQIALEILDFIPKTGSSELIEILKITRSQNGQDIVALAYNNFVEELYFVEFGATNGATLSNTYLLEKHFKWKGILSEPAKSYHRDLQDLRDCKIDHRAVFSRSGLMLEFNETKNKALSTLNSFSESDDWAELRKNGEKYLVETVSLMELLEFHDAPKEVGFLSIDTEGSEYEILYDFDFSKYSFNFICIEHNFTTNRQKIFNLLVANGYKRVHSEISFGDDYYIPSNVEEFFSNK